MTTFLISRLIPGPGRNMLAAARRTTRTLASLLTPLAVCALVVGGAACSGDDSMTTTDATGSTSKTSIDATSTGVPTICEAGAISCKGEDAVQICNPDGVSYTEIPCGDREVCFTNQCLGPCDFAEETPSSIGCSFVGARMTHRHQEMVDALTIGNTDRTETANVKLFHVPDNVRKEFLIEGPVELMPGEVLTFDMTNDFIADTSGFRTGGLYRVESDIPIVAYQHSPLENSAANDSSMLLPKQTLRNDYVVYSYPGFQDKDPEDINVNGKPSYFTVLAFEHETTVTWTSPVDTAGNFLPVPYVYAGSEGEMLLNKHDFVQIAASDEEEDFFRRDVSGTVIHADKPIWVVGGTACAFVPFFEKGFCDHLQEQLIPVEQWGRNYVGAHAPVRAQEPHIWRVFAGADNVAVATEPPLDGTPFTLEKMGDYREFTVDTGTSVIFRGSGPIMPVQYIAGARNGANNMGDPSMYAMVPVEQYLKRYAFTTGTSYTLNYVQIVRDKGGADVRVDDQTVTGYYELGDYEIADWPIEEGAHFAESDDRFGITNVGYTVPEGAGGTDPGWASYAYPGGMALEVLNPI